MKNQTPPAEKLDSKLEALQYSTKNIVAENIKFIRTTSNLTQKQFGELLGYSARTISDWEYGNTEPNIETIKRIKFIFNLSFDDILL